MQTVAPIIPRFARCLTTFRAFSSSSDFSNQSREEPEQPKWGGQTSAKIKGSKAQEVWPLLADFCNMDKWFPGLHTCYQVGGVPGQPGLVRYCERGTDETTILWAKEKLLTIDPINQCMTYEIVDNNMGFESYVATMQVVPINNHGCKIEWSFVCDQIEGTSLEDLQSFVESSLQGIAREYGACSSI